MRVCVGDSVFFCFCLVQSNETRFLDWRKITERQRRYNWIVRAALVRIVAVAKATIPGVGDKEKEKLHGGDGFDRSGSGGWIFARSTNAFSLPFDFFIPARYFVAREQKKHTQTHTKRGKNHVRLLFAEEFFLLRPTLTLGVARQRGIYGLWYHLTRTRLNLSRRRCEKWESESERDEILSYILSSMLLAARSFLFFLLLVSMFLSRLTRVPGDRKYPLDRYYLKL